MLATCTGVAIILDSILRTFEYVALAQPLGDFQMFRPPLLPLEHGDLVAATEHGDLVAAVVLSGSWLLVCCSASAVPDVTTTTALESRKYTAEIGMCASTLM